MRGVDPARLAPGWRALVEDFFAADTGRALQRFIDARIAAGAAVYPPTPLYALELTPFAAVRVVILGQDPYHGAGQAHGLAFSVPSGVRPPPSLRNMLLERARDCGGAPPTARTDGNLECWARQGVLLLNTVLTVEDGAPGSHARHGWEQLTDALVEALARDAAPKAFLLWGAQAQAKRTLIERAGASHCVLLANHPSPLSARRPPVPFLGCGHFSAANAFLQQHGRGAIDWCG
ncbi:MAG: uracil-DNA glycosylase [Burkholderiaceae bacterium]|nr:uracil-DNA glycosylase [Burkholderiaceae bacterium]